jgi:hypothetical protein
MIRKVAGALGMLLILRVPSPECRVPSFSIDAKPRPIYN